MARPRSPNRSKSEQIWIESKKKKPLKDIASELGVSEQQVRKWKNQDNWDKKTLLKKKSNIKGNVTKNKAEKKVSQKDIIKSEEESPGLTDKQRLFCLYYTNNQNATQAYLKAYGGSYAVANVEGYRNLVKPSIKAEVKRLKELKKESIMLTDDDIVERYMRIAFADMTDFVEFGQEEVPIVTKEGPIKSTNPLTGEEEVLTQTVNILKFKGSGFVDGGLICEIKTSRQGASIKLESREKALDWLTNYFEMSPEQKYKKEFDNKKLQLDRERFEHTKKMDAEKVW